MKQFKCFFLLIPMLAALEIQGDTFQTVNNGYFNNPATWAGGQVPDLLDPADSLFINHMLTLNSGYTVSLAYIQVNASGLLRTTNQFYNLGRIIVFGGMYVPNHLYNYGVMYVYTGGLVWAGVNWTNLGLAGLVGGDICWKNWLSGYPVQGSGTICGYTYQGGPLPITLTSFTATCGGNSTIIEWTTENEANNDYFTLERSLDLQTWETVSRVKGSAVSNHLLHYKVQDPEPLPGIVYYRLSQTDLDGTSRVYDDQWIRFTNCAYRANITVFPNPFTDHISIGNWGASGQRYLLYDLSNRVLQSGVLSEGDNELNTNSLKPGIYFLDIQGIQTTKIIKN